MRTPLTSLLTLLPLLSSLSSAQIVEDRLVSRRLHKRGLNSDGNYNISIYHLNDVHAHLDEFRSTGVDCPDPTKGCFGGYARVKTVIDKTRPTKEDSLFLNAGDEFQGTLFYSFYGGDKIAETMNQLGFDAMTVGNHEFDGGDDKLAEFIKKLNFPVISSNIHSDHVGLNSSFVPYAIFPKHQLAIVSATTETTPDISKPGKGTIFEDPVASIQRTVDLIRSMEGINRIIALTHIGYEEDIKLAEKTKGISLIVGGHSHTPLGDIPGAQGKYPTIAENLDGDEVFVVTAFRWGEYLGYIDVAYSPEGKIVSYTGAPIHLTNATIPDPKLQSQIKQWREPFEAFAAEVLGESKVHLQASNCRQEECILGNFMADAMVDYRKELSPNVAGAIINAGGIRAEIDIGPITRGEVLTAFPFGNSIVEVTFKGSDLWKIFESTYTGISQFNNRAVTSIPQVSSEFRVEYNPTNKNGTKLISLSIGGKPVELEKEYSIVTLDFLATGGDNFWPARNDFVVLDTQDEVLIGYIAKVSPVDAKIEGRIKTTDKTAPTNGGGKGGNGTTPGGDAGNGGNGTVPDGGDEPKSAAAALSFKSWAVLALSAVVGMFAL